MENSPLKVYIAVQHAEHLTGSQSCVQHEDVCTCLPVELLSCRVSFGCLGFQSLCRFYVSISNVSSVGFGASPEKMRPGSCRQRRWKSGRSACHTNWSSAESFTCDILIAPSLMAYFTTLHKIFWGWVHDYLHQLVLSDERSSSWFTFSKWITASFTEMQMCFQSWHPIKHNAEKAIYFSENHLILFDFYGYLGFVYLCSIEECYEIW